tara:strand:- start:740 stop:973 length:234 start_codon:yes stop_codon:yes gene_type:complete
MLEVSIFEITTSKDKITSELTVFFIQEGKKLLTNFIRLNVSLSFLERNQSRRAKIKGIRRLLPYIRAVTIEIATIQK